jgi:pimeloyl-ACP methyl ester carboxylesterase
MHATLGRRPGLLAAWLWAALVPLATAAPGDAGGASPPPRLSIDLDAFERLRRTASLPNGMTLGYAELGNPAGPPLVLIHGYTDNARDWVLLAPHLDGNRRLILVDLRGHGRSGKPECCYGLVDFAYDIKLLLDGLRIGRADVVGHSLGSVIAQTLAELWPERVRRLVLISSTARPLVLMGMSPGVDFRTEVARLADPIDPDSPFMRWWYASPTPVDAEFLRRQCRDAAAIPARVWLAIYDQGIAPADPQRTLPSLKVPILLMWGAKDFIFGADDQRILAAALPGAHVVIYPELGHNPFWEDPPRVARDINAFLRD